MPSDGSAGSLLTPPLAAAAMTKLCDFIVGLARVKALLRSKPQWMLPTRTKLWV